MSNDGEAYTRMRNRSAFSRADVMEFQEATDTEALNFLKDRLGEVKFNEKKNELDDLVENYTGRNFKSLVEVVNRVDDLKGLLSVFVFLGFVIMILC